MRTLKKALSLVLVLAMVFALAVPGFAADTTKKATSYKDYEKVTNTEAVDVLTAIGVLHGNTDGTFGPEGNFTRAEAAVMLTYMLLGDKIADALPNTTCKFADVPAWAAKYVQYCADEKIIAGYGDGKFGANDPLTAAQWALMLLKAVKADGADKIGGDGWALQATKLAMQTKLATADDMTGTFNRDAAAKLAFTALNYGKEVKTTGSKYVILATASTSEAVKALCGTKLYDSYSEAVDAAKKEDATMVVGTGFTVSVITATVTETLNSLAKDVFSLSKVDGVKADSYGRPATAWQQKDAKGVNKTIAICAKAPVATYTTTVSANELYNLLGSKAKIMKTGSQINTLTAPTGNIMKADGTNATNDITVSSKLTGIGGNGVITEIYATDTENQYITVQIQPTLAKVTNVRNIKATATEGAYTKYTIGGTTTTDYKVYTSNVSGDEKDTLTINGTIAKGDYVMVYGYVDGSVNYAVATPVKLVNGTVTGYTSSTKTYTIGGEKYALSAAAKATGLTATAPSGVTNTKATYAVDAYGYVIGAVDNAATNYIYVLNADKVSYLKDNKVETVLEAYTIDTNGELKTIVVSKVDSATALDAMKSALGEVGTDHTGAKLYEYTLDSDNNYELKSGVSDVTAITKGNAVMTGTTLKADNNTKFFVANYNAKGVATGVTAYTGYANVLGMTSVTGAALDNNSDGIADVVFVGSATEAGATTSYVYVTGDYSIGADNKTYYDVITKNGEAQKMVLTGVNGAGLYTISGGTATKVATKAALNVSAGTDGIYGTAVNSTNKFFSFQNGLLMASADDNTYSYLASINGDTAVYYYVNGAVSDEMTTVADLNGATGSQIVFAVNATKTAVDAVYIVK